MLEEINQGDLNNDTSINANLIDTELQNKVIDFLIN